MSWLRARRLAVGMMYVQLSWAAACVDDVWLGPEQARDAGSAAPGEASDDAQVEQGDSAALPDASVDDAAADDVSDGALDSDAGAQRAPAFCGLENCVDFGFTVHDCDSTRVCWPRASTGSCELTCTPSARCGRAGDSPCGEGEFCLYTLNTALCGAGDAGGFCAPRPLDCTGAIEGSACGCDGRTYETQCAAAQQGMSVAHTGPCAPAPSGGTNGGIVGN